MAVRWGAPIDVASFAHDLNVQTDEDIRAAVRKLTGEIERRMVELTVNAPDWDTLYVARIARDILWDHERNIHMQQFPDVSQALIDLFSTPNPPPSLSQARKALLTYYALLHYSNISHADLTALLPNIRLASPPSRARAISLAVRQLLVTVLHPRSLLFFPAFVAHLPAYALAATAKRALASPRQEETHTQYKAIFGMVGAGAMYGLLGSLLARMIGHSPILAAVDRAVNHSDDSLRMALEVVQRVGVWLAQHGTVTDGLVLAGSIYVTTKVLSRWHNALVGASLRQAQRLTTALKLARGIYSSPSSDLTPEQLELYGSPPEPPANRFIKRRPSPQSPAGPSPSVTPAVPQKGCQNRVPPSWKFVRPLLEARSEASYALSDSLADLEMHAASPGRDSAVSSESRGPPAVLRQLRQLGACF
ncbi:hypothetical protein EVJ58_g10053 [Rhodofomes roseus]|uniref:Uncharacterized protein n=1 Tax=Rhodofomes roseus TaxID=34475 RepID=A0A4Y9XRI5_9APHY|nr:hypothetical protein EVJ58_g10053 [Rhodofomes roseus]